MTVNEHLKSMTQSLRDRIVKRLRSHIASNFSASYVLFIRLNLSLMKQGLLKENIFEYFLNLSEHPDSNPYLKYESSWRHNVILLSWRRLSSIQGDYKSSNLSSCHRAFLYLTVKYNSPRHRRRER